MKKRLSRGEKWLFASPLLLLIVGGVLWQRHKMKLYSIEMPQNATVDVVKFSPDSKRLVVFSTTTGFVGWVYDLESRTKVCNIAKPKDQSGEWDEITYDGPDWSPDGSRIAGGVFSVGGTQSVSSVYTARTITIWDAKSGAVRINQLCQAPSYLRGEEFIHYSPDGKTLVGGGVPPAVYDATTLKPLNKPNAAFDQGVMTYSNPKLGLAAVLNVGGNGLRVFDLKTRKVLWQTPIDEAFDYSWSGDILCVYNFSREKDPKTGQKLEGSHLLLWDGKTRQQLPSPPFSPVKAVYDYDFNADNTKLALFVNRHFVNGSITRDKGELMLWDLRAKRVLWSKPMETPLIKLAWSPDGKKLAALAEITQSQRRLSIFDQNGQSQFEEQPVQDIAVWSGDSKQLATVVLRSEPKYKFTNTVEVHRFED